MNNRFVFAILLSISPFLSKAQSLPINYFTPPLDPPLYLNGTFGEIRENHFHSGIDLSTNEEEGVPVMSAADGYISRIKVAPDGYGKALYVTHPNGYVSVYGHLQKFTGAVSAYVRALQFKNQNYEMDVYPKVNEFIVKQRDVIAYSGSTGGAEGPHLHFEFRDEKSEEPINPLLMGINIKDVYPPEIINIRIYPLPENGIVSVTDTPVTYEVRQENGIYVLNTTEHPVAYGNIAFGITAIDRQFPVSKTILPDTSEMSTEGNIIQDDDNNSLIQETPSPSIGIYGAELFVDRQSVYSYKYDRFNFDNTKDVNAHIDYLMKSRENIIVERCHKLPGNHLPFYGDSLQSGYTYFGDDGSHDIKIVVKDFSGNTSQIEFSVMTYSTLASNSYMPKPVDALLVTNAKGVAIHKTNLDVVIPGGAVYEDFYYDDEVEKGYGFLSELYRVGNAYEPLHLPVTIGIQPTNSINDSLKAKAVIVQLTRFGEVRSRGGQWNGKFLTAKCNSFGRFAIDIDTIPPKVEKEYVPADMNTMYGGEVRVKITDALSGVKSYSGRIDDKWYLFEYDKKNDLITANVDGILDNTSHKIEITVTDERGNTTVWKSSFYY